MNRVSIINVLNFNEFGKSPKSLFNNLEAFETKEVFLNEKTPFDGNFLHRHFDLF
jgi:hypothetical protein